MASACDVLIIGGGLTGVAAARRAVAAGLSTVIAADGPGSLPFTSGAIDLLAVYPTETKRNRSRPWEALSELIEHEPDHPYGRVGLAGVRRSIKEFTGYLERSPLAYTEREAQNSHLITAAGTIKPTYAVPGSMRANAAAFAQRLPTLILGFCDLVDFSPEQVVGNLRDRWPGLRAERIALTDCFDRDRRLTPAALLDVFERPAFRAAVAERIRPLLGQARFLGLPAVLGIEGVADVLADLQQRLGVEVFEIPLLSPSPPGIRLARQLERDLLAAGVVYRVGAPVVRLDSAGRRITAAVQQGRGRAEEIRARAVVLASGRFFGGGLLAERDLVREPLLDLPLRAPASRDDWHMNTFLGAPGHPLNRVGIRVDRRLRPLGADGDALYENLYAAGAILADHDWVREKSGAGISVATGVAAVDSFLAGAGRSDPGARP